MSAKTENNILNKKDVGSLHAFPVKSGEVIFHNTIVGIDEDGFLKNVTLANVATLRVAGIVADDSANVDPAATKADGSLVSDKSSDDKGDKTVRVVWMKGRFLLNFLGTLTQADVGKKAYAKNNNDCSVLSTDAIAIGTIVSFYSASQAWVDLNEYFPVYPDKPVVDSQVLVIEAEVDGSTSIAVGGFFSIDNPFDGDAVIEDFALVIDSASTGAATADIGVGTTVSSDSLIDGITLNGSVTGVHFSAIEGGSNGKVPRVIKENEKIIATASASTAGFKGSVRAVIRKW